MSYNISLNKFKSIGKVVFIVEGDKKEHTLLNHIFKNILDYSIVDVKRNKHPVSIYTSGSNPYSRVFVVSSENSNIRSAGIDGNDYLDHVFNVLYSNYSLDITNAAVFYIFDRDNESNMFTITEHLTKILKNSRDNGFETNGLLLLSYPCIEAYIKSCIDDYVSERIDSPKSLKSTVSDAKYQYHNIDESSIIKACNNMLLGINEICNHDIKMKDLDDFSGVNFTLLDKENEVYLEQKQYMLLSMLSIAFIDLGILTIENNYS